MGAMARMTELPLQQLALFLQSMLLKMSLKDGKVCLRGRPHRQIVVVV
jgi:hypothetical protein